MRTWKDAVRASAYTGTFASVATTAAAAAFGKAELGRAVAPLNAVSHVLWGDQAARRNALSGKYTATGAAINHAGSMFWALVYEKLFGHARTVPGVLLGSAAVAALAYVTDYHLVPKRLTPGYELRLPKRSLTGVYGALALGLSVGALLRRSASRR
jgi:hypothetical protein